MNVFTTDHPMTSQPSREFPRLRKWFIRMVLSYPLYLLLLGPLYALDGRGFLGFLPESWRTASFLPVAPVTLALGPRSFYFRYLDWWYEDTNASETTW
jgi:hypothetical protein